MKPVFVAKLHSKPHSLLERDFSYADPPLHATTGTNTKSVTTDTSEHNLVATMTSSVSSQNPSVPQDHGLIQFAKILIADSNKEKWIDRLFIPLAVALLVYFIALSNAQSADIAGMKARLDNVEKNIEQIHADDKEEFHGSREQLNTCPNQSNK